MKFILEIELGNDAMQAGRDVAKALDKTGSIVKACYPGQITDAYDRAIYDENGNRVGGWKVEETRYEREGGLNLKGEQTRLAKPVCLVYIEDAAPGQRIGIVDYPETGSYTLGHDDQSLSNGQARAKVRIENRNHGISQEVEDSCLAASMFGWHVPAAKAAREFYQS